MHSILIADSGSTKTEWVFISGKKKLKMSSRGLSPYFLSGEKIELIVSEKVAGKLKDNTPEHIYFYGTGCSNPGNKLIIKKALQANFPGAKIYVDHDLMAAARALCGHEKGVACILGTGSNSCFFNGKTIVKNNPGLGYVLGDEGAGTYLGKKVLQYYLYNTFEPELMERFEATYHTNATEILDAVYKQPTPNAYLATFAMFLADNRGHYMIENILEDSFHDFFHYHVYKYAQSWTSPIHFVGSVAHHFKDVLQQVCDSHHMTLGKILKSPMEGLIAFHQER